MFDAVIDLRKSYRIFFFSYCFSLILYFAHILEAMGLMNSFSFSSVRLSS